MNKVQTYWGNDLRRLQYAVNDFANEHEIINVSFTSRTNAVGGEEYSVMVLYKAQ